MRIVRERGAIVVVFTSRATRLWRRVAGKRVSVPCDELPAPDEFGLVSCKEAEQPSARRGVAGACGPAI